MKFNSAGTSIANGTAKVWVNGVTPAPLVDKHAGNPSWRDDSTLILHADLGDGFRVYQYQVGGPLLPVSNHGATDLYAGGTAWAGWLHGKGYFDSHGTVRATWGVLDVDDKTGFVAVVTNRQAGTGLSIWNGSTLVVVYAGAVWPEAWFRDGLLVYRVGGLLKACDFSGVSVPIGNPPLQGVRHRGEYLLLGRDRDPLYDLYLVRWNDPTKGLLVTSTGRDFYPDLRVNSGGTVTVISSPNQGDTVPVQTYTVNPMTGPWVPLTEPVVIPTFPKTDQQIGIGLFDDLDGPRIQDFSEVVSPNTRAIFWQIGTPGQSKTKELARTLNVGAEAYKDGYGVPTVPDGFRALVFAYPTESLDVASSLGRVEMTLNSLTAAKVPCDLAVAMYCQYRQPGDYALPLQKVMDMLAGVWRLGIEYKVGALWGFTKRRMSGGQVVDGVLYWPELETCYERLQMASGDWQHFPPYAAPPETFWAPLGDL